MVNSISIEELANEIRSIKRSDTLNVEAAVEKYLEYRLGGVSVTERLVLLEKLIQQFKSVTPQITSDTVLESEKFSELLSRLLGKKISVEDFSSETHIEKMAQALNTVFDTVNKIVNVIHSTLLGQKIELETIRHIMYSQIEGEGGVISLQGYLDQIQKAFLVAHEAFKQAATNKMGQILTELDPDHIYAKSGSGLRLGFLRKAELFGMYKEKFQTCRAYFESGRLMEELLREFENVCGKLYKIEEKT